MVTAPRQPDDEDPLDAKSLDLLVSSMGADTVLVGGQALAFWMQRFGVDAREATISNDGDILGTIAHAHHIAQALKASVVVPGERALTSLVAQIRVPSRGGKARNVDVLHMLYTVGGPRKSAEFTCRVIARSVEIAWQGQSIRIMHPLDVLESRVHNAVGLLGEKGPHVLTQAIWAIEVARAAIERTARSKGDVGERLGRQIQDIHRLAHSRPGRALLKDHGIDVLDAVDVGLLRKIVGQAHEEQLERLEDAKRRRVAARSETAKGP